MHLDRRVTGNHNLRPGKGFPGKSVCRYFASIKYFVLYHVLQTCKILPGKICKSSPIFHREYFSRVPRILDRSSFFFQHVVDQICSLPADLPRGCSQKYLLQRKAKILPSLGKGRGVLCKNSRPDFRSDVVAEGKRRFHTHTTAFLKCNT